MIGGRPLRKEVTIRCTRWHASLRVTKPRSAATVMAITPKPVPPVVTVAPDEVRSRAMPLVGSAPSQK